MITGPKIGAAKEEIETLVVNGLESEMAVKGDKITFPFEIKITAKDKLYKIVKTGDA